MQKLKVNANMHWPATRLLKGALLVALGYLSPSHCAFAEVLPLPPPTAAPAPGAPSPSADSLYYSEPEIVSSAPSMAPRAAARSKATNPRLYLSRREVG